MSEQVETQAPETKTQDVAAQAAVKVQAQEQDPNWLPKRLEQAKSATIGEILKRYGAEKIEDIDAKLARLQELETSQLSEQERVKLKLQELEPKAARATQLEEAITALAQRELGGLSDLQKAAVLTLAGTDPAAQIKAVESLRPTWTSAQAPVAAPATTSAAAPPQSAPTNEVNHRARLAQLQNENPFAAAEYARRHASALL